MKSALLLSLFVFFSLPLAAAELTVKISPEAAAVKLSHEDLDLLPQQTVKATEHGGEEAAWTGVPLYQVLQQVGFQFGDSMRGKALAQYVLITASDGYRAVFALPELDPRCTNDPVILALARNNEPLSKEQGPWRLVLPAEKRHFRWVRQVVSVEVRRAE